MEPAVSALIPAYNAAATIERALDSVYAQTYDNILEVIVVDDGSTDDTAEIVREKYPDVIVIQQHNAGAAAARNVGIEHSNGEYIALLDSDDEWFVTKLERQVQYLQSNPAVDFCGCLLELVTGTGQRVRRSPESRYCSVALNANLDELARFDRVAVVGLPCHLHGIERAGHIVNLPEMIRIGLFCERTLSTLIMDRLKAVAGVSCAVERFDYRNKGRAGWPGDVCLYPVNSDKVFLDRNERMKRKDLYTPVRCRLCFDKFNVLADISCGDGYGAPYAHDGVSAVLVRTELGHRVIDDATEALHLTEVPLHELLKQHHREQRQRDCLAYAEAYHRLCPDAPVVLPEACWHIAGPTQSESAVCHKRTIMQALKFESAAERADAVRIAGRAETLQRLRNVLREVRELLVRGFKRVLHRTAYLRT